MDTHPTTDKTSRYLASALIEDYGDSGEISPARLCGSATAIIPNLLQAFESLSTANMIETGSEHRGATSWRNLRSANLIRELDEAIARAAEYRAAVVLYREGLGLPGEPEE